MIHIKSYQIRKNGHRGLVISLPAVWVEDLILRPGDKIDIYRDSLGRLLVVPPGVVGPDKEPAEKDGLGARNPSGSSLESLEDGPTRAAAVGGPSVRTGSEPASGSLK